VKLLLDEHLDPRIAAELRRRGHDVEAVVERRDLRRSSDEALWSASRAEGRSIVTHDVRDFVRLASQDAAIGKRFPCLVLVDRRRFPPGEREVGRLVVALGSMLAMNPSDDALAARMVWLEPPGESGPGGA
jgi:predicted nuclease of predicted toxin-antitoxin system